MADPRIKKLRIQTGVVKRIAKEKIMYEKEAEDIKRQIEEMEQKKEDPYVIKKRQECLQESLQMGPDCQKRLEQAVESIKELIQSSEDITEVAEYKSAVEALNAVSS